MECGAGFKLIHFLFNVCFIFYVSCICLYVAFVEKLTSSSPFCIDGKVFFLVNRG